MQYKIKEIRERIGLTQTALASSVGVSISTIQKYESGDINPPMDKLEKVANILGVDIIELMDISLEEKIERRQIKDICTDIDNLLDKNYKEELNKIKNETNLPMLLYHVSVTNSTICNLIIKKNLSDNELISFFNIASKTLGTMFSAYCDELTRLKSDK